MASTLLPMASGWWRDSMDYAQVGAVKAAWSAVLLMKIWAGHHKTTTIRCTTLFIIDQDFFLCGLSSKKGETK